MNFAYYIYYTITKIIRIMKKIVFTLLILFSMAFACVAQEVLTATRVVKSRGAESEYVIPEGDFAIDRPVLSRGGCVVKLDNWTGYYVDIWVDKNYKGRLNPWENSQMIMPSGFNEIYCRTMGESYQWMAGGECNEQFVLSLPEDDE